MSLDANPTWPPDPEQSRGFLAPMFPLPGVFLFPGQMLPLHIFEPRYRRMIEDSLDGTGRIVIAPIMSGNGSDERPEVLRLACVGEIMKFEKLPDGRFLIYLVGLSRVRIDEIECDTPYRQVRAEPFEELVPSPAEADELRDALRTAIRERSAAAETLTEPADVRILADILAQMIELPIDEMSVIYSEPRVAERARQALAAHRRGNADDDGAGPDGDSDELA